ncbi:MAG: helix-turn-helix domain-containing protein [Streptococcaceae bacterium]|jgi:transcriptional regulator with XRE-family HTH domain|nr:helix-turn-helix domain-containing protein [Streptococcaceae bacterium]
MITPFGKELRRIRLNRDLLLKHMAEKLGFTSSYLSAIENGKKRIPDNLISDLATLFKLSSKEIEKLEESKLESLDSIEFNITKMDETQKEVVFSFARRFENLSEDKLVKLRKIIEEFELKED